MATTRTAKVQAEIDKAKARLADQQAKLKELEAKRTELENSEIVDIVRGLHIPLDELAALLHTIACTCPGARTRSCAGGQAAGQGEAAHR